MTTMTLQEVRQLLTEWGDVPMGHVHMPSEYLRRMRDAIDAHLAKGAQVPEAALSVFSKGTWIYCETGQPFSGEQLDEVAFEVYRDSMLSQRGEVES